MQPAYAADNLVLELPGATDSLDDLIGRTERGLLLTCLWYIREVDPATLLLTGLTRDGVYLVEHGEIVGVGQQLPLQREPGRPAGARPSRPGPANGRSSREWNEWLNRTAMPPLRVAEFNMSSVSPAT